jgi:hypothetical protein
MIPLTRRLQAPVWVPILISPRTSSTLTVGSVESFEAVEGPRTDLLRAWSIVTPQTPHALGATVNNICFSP